MYRPQQNKVNTVYIDYMCTLCSIVHRITHTPAHTNTANSDMFQQIQEIDNTVNPIGPVSEQCFKDYQY